jgi:hypothetical protein
VINCFPIHFLFFGFVFLLIGFSSHCRSNKRSTRVGPKISGRGSLLIRSKIDTCLLAREVTASKREGTVTDTKTHRWGNAKKQHSLSETSSHTKNNMFASIAPLWFYALTSKFMEHRNESRVVRLVQHCYRTV